MLCLLFLSPRIAWAAETALQRLGNSLLDIVTPVVVALVGTLLSWLLLKLKEKTGINISEAVARQWEAIAEQAVLRAAEWARKRATELGDRKVPGPEVLEVALQWAIEAARGLGLPDRARSELVGLIEARLFKLRRDQELESLASPRSGISETPPTV